MRLLAYGGISYVERRRIGEWPEVLEGALGDPSSLPVGVLAFGVGLLEDKTPFLVVRQRQNIQNRGGYAYTLLLDPGREVWERDEFDWNGARLILSLLAHGQAGERLLTKPEEVTEQELEDIFRGLRPAPSEPACPTDTATLRALWAGAVLSPTPLVAAPADAGFDSRPTLECVADALDLLPAPFRCGQGWLVGGSEENGRAFGARLTVDDGAAPGATRTVNYITKGEKVLDAWWRIKHSSEGLEPLRKGLQQKSQRPIWEWKQHFDTSPADYLVRLPTLVEFLPSPNLTTQDIDTLLGRLDQMGRGQELPDDERLLLSRQHARTVRRRATARQTEFLLRDFFDYGNELSPEVVRRLHRAAVIGDLTRRCAENKSLTPAPAVCGLPLRRNIRYEIWRRLLAEVYAGGEAPARLRDAIQDQLPSGGPERADASVTDNGAHVAAARRPSEVLRSKLARLARETIGQAAKRGESLLAWYGADGDALLGAWVLSPLRDEAERRTLAREGNSWPLDYVAFGGDLGGRRLAEGGFDAEGAAALARAALGASQGSGALAGVSAEWLSALAGSPLRAAVPPEVKSEIAHSTADGWGPFRCLWQLYHGHDDAAPEVVSEAERARLRRELHDLVAPPARGGARPMNRTTPNLRGLVRLLGTVAEEDLRELSALRPELNSWEAARRWLDGWRELGREEVYGEELERYALRRGSAWPGNFPLDDLDDARLKRVVAHLLSAEDEGESCRHRLVSALRDGPGGRVGAALSGALDEVAADPGRRGTFARRFAGHTRTADLVFRHLDADRRHLWVSLIAASDEDRFAEEAHALYERALDDWKRARSGLKGYRPEGYARAVFEFLRTPAGERTKSQVGGWYHTIFDAGAIDLNLNELLDEAPAQDAAVEHRPGRIRRGFRRLMASMGLGPEADEAGGEQAPADEESDKVEDEGRADVEPSAGDEAPASEDELARSAARAGGDAGGEAAAAAGEAAASPEPGPAQVKKQQFEFKRPKSGKAGGADNKDDPR